MKAAINTVDDAEIAHFSAMADEWWDENGKFKPLHRINPLRIGYIKEQAGMLNGKTLLDIGCGGGLVAEPMARLGATVTGIDASEKNIAVAKLHAEQSGLKIDYRCTTAEDLLSSLRGEAEAIQTSNTKKNRIASSAIPPRNDGFDIVLALEIIEHVADIPGFVQVATKLVKPGGLIIFSTLNRTPKSFALAIIGAEYVLRWLPRGTHDWHKFVKPSELSRHLRAENMQVTDTTGMVMNPLTFEWQLNPKDLSVNYLITAKKA